VKARLLFLLWKLIPHPRLARAWWRACEPKVRELSARVALGMEKDADR